MVRGRRLASSLIGFIDVLCSELFVMEEPVKKKIKTMEFSPNDDLRLLQDSLLIGCLCPISQTSLKTSFQSIKVMLEEERQGFSSVRVENWSRDKTLLYLSSVQLLCEIALKQNSRGFVCSRIWDLCDSLIRSENGLVDDLVALAGHSDRFVSFCSGRALSAFLLVSRTHVNPRWLDKLTDVAMGASHPAGMCYSLDVIRRIVEWRDAEEHPLDGGRPDPPPTCHVLNVSDSYDSLQIKCLCIKSLESKWPAIVNRINRVATTSAHQCTVIAFLALWESIISVKANLSVVDTKPFYGRLEGFMGLLNSSMPAPVWSQVLSLYNEVLCYGSTLALQDTLAEEPCSLAHLVVRQVKDRRLLDSLPYRSTGGGFGGSGAGDRPLLQKVVLLVLKAVAVTVKETRCESSSDASSDGDDADADMAVIERSIREVLRQVDIAVKSLVQLESETSVAEWVVQLFLDQDDALIESMICCLDVTVGLYGRSPDLRRILSPVHTFSCFLSSVSHDADVLLDLLVSNETCFLLYLLRILKFIRKNWSEFVNAVGTRLDDVMSVLIRLRIAIDRLVSRALFPYNISPILKLLEKCEQMYEGANPM